MPRTIEQIEQAKSGDGRKNMRATRCTMIGLAICLGTLTASTKAQVTGSGTSGTVPVFTDSSTVGNSPISVSNGNVGIGTTNLDTKFVVAGGIGLNTDSAQYGNVHIYSVNDPDTGGSSYAGALVFAPNYYNGSSFSYPERMRITSGGKVGIGTPYPGALLDLAGGDWPDTFRVSSALNAGMLLNNTGTGGHEWAIMATGTGSAPGAGPLAFYDSSAGAYRLVMNNSGNVGIGTTSPGAKLEVNGTAQIDGALNIGNGGIVFPNGGGTQTIAYTGVTCGGDYAESVDVSGDRKSYEPGDVLVIDPASEGSFLKSAEPYSTSVTGIYSTKPGLVGRRQLTDKSHMQDEVPMAMVGIVPTKVSAENGPIKPGDLLVTSSKLGYAMKGTDRSQMMGAVIGKALGHLDSDTGVIEVVVTLQ